MFAFPKSTEFNRRIPKQEFYKRMDRSPALKKLFVGQVKEIVWRNKIATTTLNVAAGERVTELELFEIRLFTSSLDEAVLQQIDLQIPYHIIFVLEYEGKFQAWTGYKEVVESGKNAIKLSRYYHTDWLAEEALPLKLEGLNIDTLYDNLFRQIAGDFFLANTSESLKDTVEKEERIQWLNKKIDALRTKIRREPQFNRQVQLNTEMKKLQQELKELF